MVDGLIAVVRAIIRIVVTVVRSLQCLVPSVDEDREPRVAPETLRKQGLKPIHEIQIAKKKIGYELKKRMKEITTGAMQYLSQV
jgi:hypothetical protein